MSLPVIKKYPVYTPPFWRAYFIHMRCYLLFISGIAGAAGMAVTKNDQTTWWELMAAFVPFFLGYGFGQALTDCFQIDTDKISAPYRPLSQGIVSATSILAVSIAGLLVSAVILIVLHLYSFLLSGVAVAGLATYSAVKRNSWLGGPFYNAWIVALLPLMGYYALLTPAAKDFGLELFPYILVTFFSYASFVLMGYLKDIEADRTTNYKTFPVIWGWSNTIFLGDVFAIAAHYLFWQQTKDNLYEVIAGVTGSVIIVYGQLRAHYTDQKNEKGALVPILATVRSFILLHIATVLHFQPQWWLYLVLYYILFEIALFFRPSHYQV
jgi:4-hydroxybenzoate polyprenyltransferase